MENYNFDSLNVNDLPKYDSDLYKKFIDREIKINGWSLSYAGLGFMVFEKGNKEFKSREKRYHSKEWQKECWDYFISFLIKEIRANE